MDDQRRRVPRTDAVLADPAVDEAIERLGRNLVRATVTAALDRVRRGELAPEAAIGAVIDALPATAARSRPVINATGVIVHTNLGRAPLSSATRDAVLAASGYTDVEFDLGTGRRAPRGASTLAAVAAAVPAAQGVHITNNNAAALVLAATALAGRGDIVISRGELVEIGDGFRLPDLLESTGARLREVGTTNRTRLSDYADVIGPGTGFILKVHPSNFTQTGFVGTTSIRELATLGPPVVHDIGSGLLRPNAAFPNEPDATTSLDDGADLVTASADKLLGGPQAGLLLGRADLVDRLRRHPLARALRVDKLTLAALEATLVGGPSPVEVALSTPVATLRKRATLIVKALADKGIRADLVDSTARVGGGGAPEVSLPSTAVAVSAHLVAALRSGRPAVVGRVHEGRLLLDLRAVPGTDDAALISAVAAAVTE
ncbi:L-seryl-tRNA(Sec) selenium transferase [Stackebrandtia soli]|uniref:L-seryl-tRNA(Sec) selenium transferase n=1 Tax=Stackebrandtia soli TaxID=1892856 RepID=UPI0039ED9374